MDKSAALPVFLVASTEFKPEAFRVSPDMDPVLYS